MDEPSTTKRLLALRKLTRTIADLVRGQLKDYLTTLTPLLRPRHILGEYVQRDVKQTAGSSANAAFNELKTLYTKVAAARPFNLGTELTPPLEVINAIPEITNFEYVHTAKSERDNKTITVLSPLKWVLSFSGFGPRQLRLLLAEQTRSANDLAAAVQHCLMMHTALARQPGIVKLLEALHFSITTGLAAGLGELPIITIASVIPTSRAPDEFMIESTEISGTDTFEEVVNACDLSNLHDPFREKVLELARSLGEDPAAK
jgi:hypothetical protein